MDVAVYLNSSDFCIVCFEKPEVVSYDNSTIILKGKILERIQKLQLGIRLIRHHVSYFPEEIAFVHADCHKKIHDTPLDVFRQYADGDSRKFYDMKREGEK